MSEQQALDSPFYILNLIFLDFNVITLTLTVIILFGMFLLRKRIQKIPWIGILVILGIIVNYKHPFKSYSDVCSIQGIDCQFYILDPRNLNEPLLNQVIQIIPSSLVLTAVILFEQLLYLQEFERRGKRFKNQGSLGQVTTQTKVLAVANLISGCLGGLPISINIFGTYQNFAFNNHFGFKGTKWVGLLQIPFSFLLYTFADFLFEMIPLFVLFTIVATPAIYFVHNVITYHWTNLPTILFIAVISVCTHPIIALIFACFVSIYEISELLKPAPAEMIVESAESLMESGLTRKSSLMAAVVQKNQDQTTRHINQFANRVVEIDDDIPDELQEKDYLLYRFIGIVMIYDRVCKFYEFSPAHRRDQQDSKKVLQE